MSLSQWVTVPSGNGTDPLCPTDTFPQTTKGDNLNVSGSTSVVLVVDLPRMSSVAHKFLDKSRIQRSKSVTW